MTRLALVIFFLVLTLSSKTLAAQDSELQQLIERIQSLEETVELQNRELESQRIELEELRSQQDRHNDLGYRSGIEYEIPEERLQGAVEEYLNTEEGKELVAKSSPAKVRAGYKGGFYLETLDDKFRLDIHGRTQVRYTFATNDDSRDTSSFRIRRQRITLKGHAFVKDLTYRVMWDLAPDSGRGTLLDAYANYKVTDWLQLRGGQYKVPYNRHEITSSGKLQFVDRSIANAEFNLFWDIGVMAHSKPMGGLLEYYLAMMTGAGANITTNTNNKMLYVARLVVNPLGEFNSYSYSDLVHYETPKLALGVAFATDNGEKLFIDSSVRTFNRDANVKQATVDLMFKWRGFSFFGDGYWRELNTHSGESGFRRNGINANGYTLQAGYFVPLPYVQKHLEFAGRYSYVDPDTKTRKDSEREVGGAINWFFNGHSNKLQADVRRITTKQQSKEDIKDTEFRLQYQLVY